MFGVSEVGEWGRHFVEIPSCEQTRLKTLPPATPLVYGKSYAACLILVTECLKHLDVWMKCRYMSIQKFLYELVDFYEVL